MKRIATVFCLFFVIALCAEAQVSPAQSPTTDGPSLVETVAWIRAHVLLIDGEYIGQHALVLRNKWERSSGAMAEAADIYLPSVTGIILDKCEYLDTPRPCIRLTGTFQIRARDIETREFSGDTRPATTGYMYLDNSTNLEDAQHILKAIKHLAVLNGAKIPKDDLFD